MICPRKHSVNLSAVPHNKDGFVKKKKKKKVSFLLLGYSHQLLFVNISTGAYIFLPITTTY